MRQFIMTFNIIHYYGQCTVIQQNEFQNQHNRTLEIRKALLISLETLVSVFPPSLGPHCFIVPVRDENGSLYPGVTVVDMMHKEGEFAGGPSSTLLCAFASSPPDPASCRCSVSKSSSTLCDPVNCSTPGFPVLRYLLQFTHTHAH